MYGIAAITAKNGWAMALAGALIVMTGLSVLALVISQLHKLAQLIENRRTAPAQPDTPPPAEKTIPSFNIEEIKTRYGLMAQQLGDSFELTRLYHLARDSGFPHVHLSIRSLRETGQLVPLGDGMFSWQK
ncbi:MAG: hypothetical protein AMJ54_07115 [Deltaproteobacteria bacterium SG8_13]|nr:MAG: hypothetical protein AMJ54_07115 [Deltaproteobacteria bacterium SG8_13]